MTNEEQVALFVDWLAHNFAFSALAGGIDTVNVQSA